MAGSEEKDNRFFIDEASLEGKDTLFDDEEQQQPKPKGRVLPVISKGASPSSGKPIVLKKSMMVIGRLPSCDIVLEDMKVSRKHARISYKNMDNKEELPVCMLIDEGSSNGTYVNGVRIHEPHILRSGDQIIMGRTMMWYYLRSELELEEESKFQKVLKKHGIHSLDEGFSPNCEVDVEILYPEKTFSPQIFKGQLKFVSGAGMRINSTDMSHEQYVNTIKTTRYAKVHMENSESGENKIIHTRVSWLHFEDQSDPPRCTMGLAFEKLDKSQREFLENIK